MTFVSSGVKRGIAVVIAEKQQVVGEISRRDMIQLTGFGGGVNDREAGFTRDDHVVVNQELIGNLAQITGDGRCVQDGISGSGLQHQ